MQGTSLALLLSLSRSLALALLTMGGNTSVPPPPSPSPRHAGPSTVGLRRAEEGKCVSHTLGEVEVGGEEEEEGKEGEAEEV